MFFWRGLGDRIAAARVTRRRRRGDERARTTERFASVVVV
jgi:hypothetical protein